MLAALERMSVPVPFLVMLALLPETRPEVVIVSPEATFQVLVELVPKVRLPETELFPVAFKLRVPARKFEEILIAPVKEFAVLAVHGALLVVLAFVPESVMLPVPAFAIMLTAFQVPEDPF